MENLITQPSTLLAHNINSELKWADSFSKEMNWLNNVMSNVEEEENEDIVERFTFMSNINRNTNVSPLILTSALKILVLLQINLKNQLCTKIIR